MSTTPAEEARALGLAGGAILPVGTTGTPWVQNFDRTLCQGTALTPGTGVMNLTAIWLPVGATVTGISMIVIGAPTTSTHLWLALYRADLGANSVLMAQSTDDVTATDAPANTLFRKALTAPQVLPYTGLYYVGWMQTSSGQNTLQCAVNQSVNGNGNIAGMTPVLAFTHATTGLTTAAPATLGATTAVITQRLWCLLD
jgi:hypothetical protein